MSEWSLVRLDEIGTLQRGRSRHRPRYAAHLYGGPYPFVQTGEIREARKHINSWSQTYSEDGLKQSRLWPRGTLCITIAANIAELAILGVDACFPDSVLGFIPNKTKSNLDFIYYTLCFFQRELKHAGEGSVQDNINLGTFQDILFPLPPLPEQQAIASVLSSLDDKIDLLHRQNTTLEAMATALFRQWFVEDDCQLTPITSYVHFNPTRKLSKGTPAPYLDMAAVSTSTFNPSGWWDREFSSGTKFMNGDTLLARITPCLENGKSCFVTFLGRDQVGWGSTEFIVMKSMNGLSDFFTYALARTQEFRDYAEGCMSGSSGRQRVDVEHLRKFEVKELTKERIEEFNRSVEPIPLKLHANMLQLTTLEKLRDTLLPKLMSGEVRVQYEEAAS